MPAIAKGIRKQTIIMKQSALGSMASGAGGQILRRRNSVFQMPRDTFESDEVVSHQQDTGIAYGLKKPTGKLDGLLSCGTYKLLMAALLRKDFVAGATTGAITTVTAAAVSGASGTFTRSVGSFLTDGFKVGDVIRWTGWTTTGTIHNSRNIFITALTATVMTGLLVDGSTFTAKAAGDSVTGTVVGKKTLAPLTAHTNDYFTVEEWYPDITKSERFIDHKVMSMSLDLPATGNVGVSFDFIGLNRTLATSQNFTSPTTETTTSIMTAVNGALYINGTLVAVVTGVQINVNGGQTMAGPVIGSNSAPDIADGDIKVSGQFVGLFDGTTIQSLYDAETVTNLIVLVTADLTATSDFMVFNLGRIKITNDAPDDGMKAISRTYPFTAEINTAGGAALANDQTILSIQDSQA